jgi:hypothetical protein
MKKGFLVVICLIWCVVSSGQDQVISQSQGRPKLSERLFFGGSFGLQFGTITNIEVAPTIGIWLLPRVAVAAGPSFQYYKDPFGKTAIYGGKTFLQLTLIQDLNNIIPIGLNAGIFVQGEYEGLSLERSFFTGIPEETGRLYYDSFLAGAGISQPTGKRSSMNITVLWCITDNSYGIYDKPEIRITFYF